MTLYLDDECERYCDYGCNYWNKFLKENRQYDNEEFINYIVANNKADKDSDELNDVSKKEIMRLVKEYKKIKNKLR